MDIFILLTTMLVCFLIGMPIAYSLAMQQSSAQCRSAFRSKP